MAAIDPKRLHVGHGDDYRAEITHIERYADEVALGEAAAGWPDTSTAYLAGGNGVTEKSLAGLAATLGITRRFDYLASAGHYETNAAHGMIRFIERHPAATLIHVNRDDRGHFTAVRLTTR